MDSIKIGDAGIKRDFTLISNIEKLVKKYNLKLYLKKNENCWCAFPNSFYSILHECKSCGQLRHEFCDPGVAKGRRCAVCRKGNSVHSKEDDMNWNWDKSVNYQDNRYNWSDHIVPIPNPVWEIALTSKEKDCKHHVFRNENGVWGVSNKKIKDILTIDIRFIKEINTETANRALLRVLNNVSNEHVEIHTNRKDICNALGEWVFK